MKRFFKAMATAAVTLMAMQANAIQVTYSFRVNSSGPSIYPCNAGILNDNPHGGDKVACYTAHTHKKCNPNCVGLDCKGGNQGDGPNLPNPTPSGFSSLFGPPPPSFNQGQCQNAGGTWTHVPHNSNQDQDGHAPWGFCSCNGSPLASGTCSGGGDPETPQDPRDNACVCTTDSGRKFGNHMTATHVPWADGEVSAGPEVTTVKQAGLLGSFEKVFGGAPLNGEVEAYNHVLKSLVFNLGSELYTAKYFVDICYRGSQIDHGVFNTKWKLLGESALSDFGVGGNTNGYSKLAGLEVKAYIKCTLRNKSCTAGNCDPNNDVINEGSVAWFNDDFLNLLGGTKPAGGYHGEGSWNDPAGAGVFQTLLGGNSNVDLGDQKAPRFCKVRYVFSETNGLDASTAIHRKWQKHGANICTHTKIELGDVGTCTNCEH